MFEKSVQILKVALTVFMEMYGKESLQVATMLNYLGGTYARWGQYQESRYAIETIGSTKILDLQFLCSVVAKLNQSF